MVNRPAEPSAPLVAAALAVVAVCCALPLVVAGTIAVVGAVSGLSLVLAVAGIGGAGVAWWRHRHSCLVARTRTAEPSSESTHERH